MIIQALANYLTNKYPKMIIQALANYLTNNGIKYQLINYLNPIIRIQQQPPKDHVCIRIRQINQQIILTTYTNTYYIDHTPSTQKTWDIADPRLFQELTQHITNPEHKCTQTTPIGSTTGPCQNTPKQPPTTTREGMEQIMSQTSKSGSPPS